MGIEMADFASRELLFGLTTHESYLDLSAQDLEFGFNETRRDRILRTYVRNVYFYHLNEIYSALKVSVFANIRYHRCLTVMRNIFFLFFISRTVPVGCIYRMNTPIGRSRHGIRWDQEMLRSNY